MKKSWPPGTLCKQKGEVSTFLLVAIDNTATIYRLPSLGQVYLRHIIFTYLVFSHLSPLLSS